MNDAPEAVKVFFEGAPAPKPPKVTLWHWIVYYVYNITRKPKVWRMKRELNNIYKDVSAAVVEEVLPELWQVRLVCPNCRNTYGTLKGGQGFTSMIRMILKNMRCDEHPDVYNKFLFKHFADFERSEALAAWINGF